MFVCVHLVCVLGSVCRAFFSAISCVCMRECLLMFVYRCACVFLFVLCVLVCVCVSSLCVLCVCLCLRACVLCVCVCFLCVFVYV